MSHDLSPDAAAPVDSWIVELVTMLSDASASRSPREVLETGGEGFRLPGLYSWWVDETGANDLSVGLDSIVAAGLIYAGLSGATRWPSGKRSANTLWGRLTRMHLGGRHRFSTFRLSLGSVLAAKSSAAEIDEIALTAWMLDHLRVNLIPFPDADVLGRVETQVLAQLDPPLNLDKVPKTETRRNLSELRRRYR